MCIHSVPVGRYFLSARFRSREESQKHSKVVTSSSGDMTWSIFSALGEALKGLSILPMDTIMSSSYSQTVVQVVHHGGYWFAAGLFVSLDIIVDSR